MECRHPYRIKGELVIYYKSVGIFYEYNADNIPMQFTDKEFDFGTNDFTTAIFAGDDPFASLEIRAYKPKYCDHSGVEIK